MFAMMAALMCAALSFSQVVGTATTLAPAPLGYTGGTPVAHMAGTAMPPQDGGNGGVPISASFYYDICHKTLYGVGLTKIRDLSLRGKPTGFHVDGFLGTSLNGGAKTTVGFDLAYSKTLFDQLYVFAALGAATSGGRAASGGVLAGFGWRL